MSERNETQQEVFADLLDTYSRQHTFDDYPVHEQIGWETERAGWLQRFDTAATRTAAVDVFVEALSEGVKEWVKKKAVEATQWKSVKEELPPEDTDVLILVVDSENRDSPGRIVLATRDSSFQSAWYDGDFFYEDYEVPHWRWLPAPPMETSK